MPQRISAREAERFSGDSAPSREDAYVGHLQRHAMQIRGFGHRAALAIAVVATSLWFAPSAIAHVHVGVGISVPGISVGVGNCWRCGYVAAPPVYYQPAYPAPVYYGPAPVYYAPSPAYYGYSYGYYAPYYPPQYYRGHYPYHRGYYRHAGGHGHSGRYYHHR
ncbi:MAG: hypothetical protein ACREPU_05285 [Rhodanobacteraceae bacterium]